MDAEVAAVLGMDMAPFEALVAQLMSAANDQRGLAEQVFNQCKTQHPDALALKLIATLQSGQKMETRQMSCILLRKLLTKDEVSLFTRLNPTTQATVKTQLLNCVQLEEGKSTLKKLCDTVAELAATLLEVGAWPELLPFMFQCVSSQVARLQECALLMFAQLAPYMGPELHKHLPTLHAIFYQCLSSTNSPSDVRVAALRATAAFVPTLDLAERDRFQTLIPGMVETLSVALAHNEEATAQEALEMFVEIAGAEPRFMRKQLVEVVSTIMHIAEAEQLEDATRHMAVEFLITLAEAREKAPGMMRKLPVMISRLFATLVKFLVDVDDVEGWHTAESEEEDTGETSNYEVGQECLDRMAISLGGNTILPVASQVLPAFVSDQDWKKRHAALITLAQIAEGCSKVMVKNLDSVVSMILNSFQDPHPRVRWAAINAIGQLSTDLGPDLQQQQHQRVLPGLVQAMDDFRNPRVQAHATAAVLNFSESCSPEILAPYLEGVVSKLLMLLQNGKKMVQEGALTALASVADSSQAQFKPYYDLVMPFLMMILHSATDKATRMLRAKSMECISLVGMAVGKDKFREDAKKMMDILITVQVSQLEDDDPTISYMLQAWARLCKCLGQEFLPYMSVVMPPLLRSAQLKPDVTITDADTEDDGNVEEDDTIETITIGDKKIGIKTSVLEEKATACNMLCCYADELKEGFYPWIDQVAPILVPLLKFYFHEEVRKAAVSAMPELLRSGKLAVEKGQAHGDPTFMKRLTDYIVTQLIEALHKEPETDIISSMLDALNECVQLVGPLLDQDQIKAMVEELKQVLTASSTRRRDRAERTKAEDFDAEESEMLHDENETEEEVFDQVGEFLGTLIKTYKASFVPFFDELIPYVTPMLGKDRSNEERRVAICIFDDVAEQCGPAAIKYYDTFLPFMLEAANDTHADVRQAAVYGVGVCAEFGGQRFKPVGQEALERLKAVVTHPASRNPENVMATDNAVSALGKICRFQRDSIDASQVVPAWLGCLPLKADLVEAKIVHEQLCAMVESSDPLLLGPNNQFLPKIVSVFAEILSSGSDLSNEQTASRMVNLLRQMQQSLSPAVLASTWSALQPQQQAALQSILSSPAV